MNKKHLKLTQFVTILLKRHSKNIGFYGNLGKFFADCSLKKKSESWELIEWCYTLKTQIEISFTSYSPHKLLGNFHVLAVCLLIIFVNSNPKTLFFEKILRPNLLKHNKKIKKNCIRADGHQSCLWIKWSCIKWYFFSWKQKWASFLTTTSQHSFVKQIIFAKAKQTSENRTSFTTIIGLIDSTTGQKKQKKYLQKPRTYIIIKKLFKTGRFFKGIK